MYIKSLNPQMQYLEVSGVQWIKIFSGCKPAGCGGHLVCNGWLLLQAAVFGLYIPYRTCISVTILGEQG